MAADASAVSPIMDEARRFVRHVMPGAAFLVQVWLYCALLKPKPAIALPKDIPFSSSVGVLLASVGIGFLLSTIHHALYWHLPRLWHGKIGAIHYAPILGDAVEAGLLSIYAPNGTLNGDVWTAERVRAGLGTGEAWRIVTRIWHESSESVAPIKNALARNKSLFDVMHALGAALWGVVTAAALALWVRRPLSGVDSPHWIAFAVTVIALLVAHWAAYHMTREHAKRFLASALVDGLIWRKDNSHVVSCPVLPVEEACTLGEVVICVVARGSVVARKCLCILLVAFIARPRDHERRRLNRVLTRFEKHVRSLGQRRPTRYG